jgi:hypothetical protein
MNMMKFINVTDLLLIGMTAYGFTWGVNYALRSVNRNNLQA